MTEVQATAGTDITPLLQPIQVGQLQLKNRFVMPGMQRAWCVDGAPDERLREYYRRRALGGTALVVCEACAVDHPSAASNPMFARLDARTADAWRACVDAVHEADGRIFLQLWHQGAVDTGKAGPDFTALSPSGLEKAGKSFGRPASAAELSEIIQAFARCAVIARENGADGVEVHACHGYLLDQFLWPETNRRTDRYGGASIADRAAFPAEVVAAVRAAVGPDYPVSIRLSQWKEADYEAKIVASPDELGQLISILRSAGTDLFHVSTRRFWTPEWPGSDLGLAGWAKSFTDAPVIAVGSVGLDIDVMATLTGEEARPTGASRIGDLVRRFERGDFDLISIGRSLIGDPDWVAKMRDGRGAEIRPFRRTDLEWLSLSPIRLHQLRAILGEGRCLVPSGGGDLVTGGAGKMREVLRGMAVFPAELPEFDVRSAPGDPVTLFLSWLAEAVRDDILGPHAMTLATADAAGRVSSRVLICKDVDEDGSWYFASDMDSVKGRDLAANPSAAASFFWPQHGRQIRISGEAASAGSQASAADFLARPPASRAAALTGHQSEPLPGPAELDEAFRRSQAEVESNPNLIAPGWTLYALSADTVEFWQADHQRRHIRLQYERTADKWTTRLLWP